MTSCSLFKVVSETKLGAISGKVFGTVARINLGTIKGKKTKQCFIDPLFGFRDDTLDCLLPEDQPEMSPCTISAFTIPKFAPESEKGMTFVEWAAMILGVSPETSPETLEKLLKECDHTMALTQDENMVEDTENKLKLGLETDMHAGELPNFSFAENDDGKISVVRMFRARTWDINIFLFGFGAHWSTDIRFFIRNFDPSVFQTY
ncbi:MAG: hypothetical protein NTY93_02095 [Candidatus Kaiserbacteria bacterium]|nr:hypothetical protein [Candidatus Kaiserbacteria bacterium]